MYSDVSGRPAHRPTQTYNCNQGANTVQILYERHESLLRPQSRNLIVCPGTAIDKHFAEFVGPGGSINCKRCGDKHTQEDFGWKLHFNKHSVTNRIVLWSCGPLPLACLNDFKNTQIAIADWSK